MISAKSDHSTQHAFVIAQTEGEPPIFEIDGRELPRELAIRWLAMFLDDEARRDFQDRQRRRRAEVEH